MSRKLRPLTPERAGDLPEPCASCALWETPGSRSDDCGSTQDLEGLRQWLGGVASEWGEAGRIAYEDGEVLGFVKYAPGRYFPKAASMPAGPPDDDAVLLACIHVSADARYVGLGKLLLQAAVRDLATRGERALEAYGAADRADRERMPLASVEFLLRQGFTVVRPHPRYPLLRVELRSLAVWTENLEAALEALALPLRVRERVPAPLARSHFEGRR